MLNKLNKFHSKSSGLRAALALRFDEGSVDSRLVYSRAVNPIATYVDSNGDVQISAHNLLLQSETMTASPWANGWGGGVVITPDAAVAPDGTMTADKLQRVDNTNNGYFQDYSIGISSIFNISVYIKTADSDKSQIFIWNSTDGVYRQLTIDWVSGEPVTAGSVGASNINYEDVSDGWFRCSVTFISSATVTANRLVYIPGAGSVLEGSVYYWGSQINTGPDVLDYVPTTTQAEGAIKLTHTSAGVPLGVLLEKTAKNLVRNNYFQSGLETPWTVFGTQSDAFQVVSGGLAGLGDFKGRVARITTSGFEGQKQTIGVLTATEYTISVYAANLTGSGLNVSTNNGLGNQVLATGWNTFTYTTNSTSTDLNFFSSGGAIGEGGDFSHVTYEIGSVATSGIPTASVAVTRAADSLTLPDVTMVNQLEGTIVAQFVYNAAAAAAGFPNIVSLNNGTANNEIKLFYNAGAVTLSVMDGGVAQALISAGTLVDGDTVKVAASYKANSFKITVNGSALVPDNAGTIPTVTGWIYGNDADGGNEANTPLAFVDYYNRQLSATQLQRLAT